MVDDGRITNASKEPLALQPGVVSVGEAIRDGRRVAVMTLEHGTDPATVSVPDTLEGHPVVIDYSDPITPDVDIDNGRSGIVRPVRPGAETAAGASMYKGTMGPLMVADDGTYYLTSNAHVWSEHASLGTSVTQPQWFGDVDPRVKVGTLEDGAYGSGEAADAAIAVSDPATGVSTQIYDTSVTQSGSRSPSVGDMAEKSGITTGVTAGEVTQTGVYVNDAGGLPDQFFYDAHTDPGDSGSPVYDPETGEVLGIHWGGTSSGGVASDITNVEEIFGLSVATSGRSGNGEYDWAPDADFDVVHGGGLEVVFDSTVTSDLGGQVTEAHWDFGNGDTHSAVVVAYTYNEPGTYDVTVTVTDNHGNTDTATKTVTVDGTDGAGCSDTFKGTRRVNHGYRGDERDLFRQWRRCEVSTQKFQEDTGGGDGTDAVVPGEERVAPEPTAAGGLLVVALGLAGAWWYRSQ